MSIQFFSHGSSRDATMRLPSDYQRHMRWAPQIGDIFPNFSANSTKGRMRFHEWAEGSWVYFFSHPAAFRPVCTTEMAEIAQHCADFAERNVKLLSISMDSVKNQRNWAADISNIFGVDLDFPQVSDPRGTIVQACDMIHHKESRDRTIRKSFIIDPSLRIRMSFEYPIRMGRSVDETLRVIDALQTIDKLDVATPSDWEVGDPMLMMPDMTVEQADRKFGKNWSELRSYLRMVNL